MYEGWVITKMTEIEGQTVLDLKAPNGGLLRERVIIDGTPPDKSLDVPTRKTKSTLEQIDLDDALNLSKAHANDVRESHAIECKGIMQLTGMTQSSKTSRCPTCGTRVTSTLAEVLVDGPITAKKRT